MTIRRYGPHAVLLRFAEEPGDDARRRRFALIAEIERNPPPGLVEYVPGFVTLLLRFDPAVSADLDRIGHDISARLSTATLQSPPERPITEIPVIYDGEDLQALADAKALSPAGVVGLHSAPIYHVQLIGFSPGFPYLGDLHPALHTPRRAAPRPRISAGSVAIGGEHTGIYSVDSPGGWHIIGRTHVRLFDDERAETAVDPGDVFLLQPGDRVRFVPVEERT